MRSRVHLGKVQILRYRGKNYHARAQHRFAEFRRVWFLKAKKKSPRELYAVEQNVVDFDVSLSTEMADVKEKRTVPSHLARTSQKRTINTEATARVAGGDTLHFSSDASCHMILAALALLMYDVIEGASRLSTLIWRIKPRWDDKTQKKGYVMLCTAVGGRSKEEKKWQRSERKNWHQKRSNRTSRNNH
jgi:hypothetical protein